MGYVITSHTAPADRDVRPIISHSDVADFIESLAPPRGDDEGFKFGNPRTETRGVLVCFMATLEAMKTAARLGCNLIVHHEELHVPYTFRDPDLHKYMAWPVNTARFSTLAQLDLTAYRAHGQLDRFCILDAFARKLGLGGPSVREGYYRAYDMEPVTVGELAARIKSRIGMSHLRVSGDLDRIVRRAGLPWGGLGLSVNVGFLNGLLQYDPDVLIAGECDEYAFRFTEDAGIPMIETGHSTSENPGLQEFAQVLGRRFPGLAVHYHEVPCPWRTL